MKSLSLFAVLAMFSSAQAKTFQNSYVAFEVPDNWNCLQEGVAWTCIPTTSAESREAVIVLAAKVAGPEDNLTAFSSYLKEPRKIKTRVGTPMPSQVMYAQQRALGGHTWVQSQHLGSEIQEFYTLYLATVKDQLAILVSFSAEKTRYTKYNPVFDRAIKTLKIVASQELLFNKNRRGGSEVIGIQAGATPGSQLNPDDMLPPPARKSGLKPILIVLGFAALILGGLAYHLYLQSHRQKRRKSAASAKTTDRNVKAR
jgi:hypothetical protein